MKIFSKTIWFLMLAILFACTPQQRPQAPQPIGDNIVTAPPSPYKAPEIAPSEPSLNAPDEDVIIGMLLPLTGQHSELGNHMQDAALMGLYDKLKSLNSLQMIRNPKLLIKDTAGDTETTRKATRELLNSGAKIILGPLLSANVKVAGELTKAANIPLISFSNNPKVAAPDIYVFGFRSEEQVSRIAEYALDNQIQHFASLAPQNEYSRKVVREFSDIVKKRGNSLQPVNFFTEGQMPPAPVLNRIVSQTQEWGDKRKGVFLPVTGKSLYAISSRLMNDKNINPAFIKLLGTGLWDDESVLGVPALQGAWFATSPPTNAQQFNSKFMRNYSYRPLRMASLAYDAVALSATLALTPRKSSLNSATLTSKTGFSGPANGVFRFSPNGLTERSLSIVEIAPSGFKVISPASSTF